MPQTCRQALTQRAIQAGSRVQARLRNGLHNGDHVQLQGDGAEHFRQRLAAVDANAFILQGVWPFAQVRARRDKALRPQASGIVVLHQQAHRLILLVDQHRVLLVGLKRDAVLQPEPQMNLQQQVEIIIQPMLQGACVEALNQLLEEQPAISQRAGQRSHRYQRGVVQARRVTTHDIGQMAALGSMATVLFINVQVPRCQRWITLGQGQQRGLKPVAVIQGARLDQAQIACPQGGDQQWQLDMPLGVINAHQRAHGQRRFDLHGGAWRLERAFRQAILLKHSPGQRMYRQQ